MADDEVKSTDSIGNNGSQSPFIDPTASETEDEMLSRHRKEVRALVAKDLALKKEAAKGSKSEQKTKKKAVADKVAKLESDMKERHQKELSDLKSKSPLPATAEVVVLDAENSLSVEESHHRVSKSQKRKEKRLQEEAERERRIAEEKKGTVSQRVVELLKLDEKLRPEGLKVKEMRADGNCLYRAVEDQLALAGEPVESHSALRSMAADFMRQNKDHFLPFVLGEQDDQDGDPDRIFQKYCNDVESTASWGGHIELEALAKSIGRPILVLSADSPDLLIGSDDADVDPLRVSYHRHAYGLGEHFNSIVPSLKLDHS